MRWTSRALTGVLLFAVGCATEQPPGAGDAATVANAAASGASDATGGTSVGRTLGEYYRALEE